ncbi:molybdopterin-guanine dinucleotide biosynthesis protein A [Pedobacter sp. UYP30]|uniref:molybdenum cofactor guanylyltransferase n=1 Tax=Pedobacter sp. UYP30 TaxID=1756400 RepID=UPI003397F379
MDICGLILAGGQSKRAGTDKGLKLYEEKTWVELLQNKLIKLGLEAMVSINIGQQESYKRLIPEDKLILDSNNIPGPLRGILSAHRKFPEKNWLILACDMIDMREAVMQQLINSCSENKEFDFYAFKNKYFFQPFCGIYTSSGLRKLSDEINCENATDYSMQHVFKKYKTYTLNLPIAEEESFNNYNK